MAAGRFIDVCVFWVIVALASDRRLVLGNPASSSSTPMECLEVSSSFLESTATTEGAPSAWEWMGAMVYNPVLLERFRQTAHLEGPEYRCTVSRERVIITFVLRYPLPGPNEVMSFCVQRRVEIETMSGRWQLCADTLLAAEIHLYSLVILCACVLSTPEIANIWSRVF